MTEGGTGVGRAGPRAVVAYDGSAASDRALRFALDLTQRLDGEVWVVHALIGPSTIIEPRTDEERATEPHAIESGLQALQRKVDPEGRFFHFEVREGPAADVILAVAREVRADFLVVGTRGLRGASRMLLGSVSQAVVARAPCPVTIVP